MTDLTILTLLLMSSHTVSLLLFYIFSGAVTPRRCSVLRREILQALTNAKRA